MKTCSTKSFAAVGENCWLRKEDCREGEEEEKEGELAAAEKDRPNNIAAASVFTRREVLEQPVGWFVTAATPLTSN